jgi:GR25 family glycosyltransferase involved in LPS biosynthesis
MKIDRIFIINLKHREDRRENVVNELKKAKLENYEIFDAVQPKTIEEINNWNPNFVNEKPDWLRSDFLKFRLGSLGCLLSHVEIMKTSLERGYEQILILEDDAEFRLGKHDSFNEVLESFESQLNDIKFDMFYFGGTHEQDKLWRVSENIFQTKGTGTTGAYIINSRGMKLILRLIKGYSDAIDVFYKKSAQQILKCYTIMPALIIQKDSYSDIVQTDVKYNFDRLYTFN